MNQTSDIKKIKQNRGEETNSKARMQPLTIQLLSTSQVVLMVKTSPANAREVRDVGAILGSGRSPRGGHGNPLQYSCCRIPWTAEPGGL